MSLTVLPTENFITVEIRDVYGKPTCYPVDSSARAFAAIAGTKTLTQATLIQVLALCFSVVLVSRGSVLRIFRANDLHALCDLAAV